MRELMEELELITNQLEALETEMVETLKKTEVSEYLLSITGMGVVSLATCLGELGDPLRFENARQILHQPNEAATKHKSTLHLYP